MTDLLPLQMSCCSELGVASSTLTICCWLKLKTLKVQTLSLGISKALAGHMDAELNVCKELRLGGSAP